MKYNYFINLDERGEFYADLRDLDGNTVFEVDTEIAFCLTDEGFIKDIRNGQEVVDYCVYVGIVPENSECAPE